MRLTTIVIVAALGAGCARAVPVDSAADVAPSASAVAASPDLEPCQAPGPDEYGPWRMVRGAGFTFCVPTSWTPSAPPPNGDIDRRTYRFADGSMSWSQSGRSPTVNVSGAAGMVAIQPLVQRTTETIGGQVAELSIAEWPDQARLRTAARWTNRSLYFFGQARTRDAAELELAVYRTVRFANP